MTDLEQRARAVAIVTHGCECRCADLCETHSNILAALTAVHADGRREGLAEAAAVADGRAQRARPDSEIRTAYLLRRDEAERVALMIRAKTKEGE